MRRIGLMVLAAMTAFSAISQERPEKPQRMRMFQRQMMQGQGPWLVRMFTKKENFAKLAIADKAKSDRLFADLCAIKEEGNALEKRIRDISREQAELMRKLFADKASDCNEVMAKIDDVARLRADQARLSVKTIMLLRENLTDEQMQNARSMIMERGKMRRSMRQDAGNKGEGRRPRGNGRKAARLNSETME